MYSSSSFNYKLHLLWPPMDFPNILLARVCISDLHLQWPLMGSNGLHLSYCLHLHWSPSSNHKLHLLWSLNLQWLFVPVPREGFASTGPRSYVAYIDINAPHWGTSPLNQVQEEHGRVLHVFPRAWCLLNEQGQGKSLLQSICYWINTWTYSTAISNTWQYLFHIVIFYFQYHIYLIWSEIKTFIHQSSIPIICITIPAYQ